MLNIVGNIVRFHPSNSGSAPDEASLLAHGPRAASAHVVRRNQSRLVAGHHQGPCGSPSVAVAHPPFTRTIRVRAVRSDWSTVKGLLGAQKNVVHCY